MKIGKTNREYKDRLFKFIFGNPENKEWTLELYNAVNGSNYDNPDDIMFNTIDDVVYMGMKNDVSFLIQGTMNLYEQQSTYCPNMPVRFYMYSGKLLEGYIQMNDIDIYSTELQKMPKPNCICFYNGLDKQEDRKILGFSDMFIENTKKVKQGIEPIVELQVIMININYGHNKELLEKCKPLYEYSFFVHRIRFYISEFEKGGKAYTLEDAVDRAIVDLPRDFKILKFILIHRQEVKDMCLFEYDEERHMRGEREIGRKEGEKIGIEKNMLEMVRDGFLPEEEAAKRLGISVKELREKLGSSK